MEQNNMDKDTDVSEDTVNKDYVNKEDLEKKIGFWDRAKYASIPAALTVGAYFIPNLKNKYNNLSEEKKNSYKSIALAGTTLLGAIVTVASGYNLLKKNKEESKKE